MYLPSLFLVLVLVLPSNSQERNRGQVPEESPDLFEGDIVIPKEEEELLESGKASAGIIGLHHRWKHATVPFQISNDFDSSEYQMLYDAMAEISAKTCIRFKPHERERSYIIVRDGDGCSSEVGRSGRHGQVVTLGKSCISKGTAIHELVHVIGFWHEQSRTDRDNYVTIKFYNIHQEKRQNFNKYTTQDVNDFGVPYDYDSVMHYHDRAFISTDALRKGEKTIVPRDPGAHIGQRKYLSKLDAKKINRMYNCPRNSETIIVPSSTTTTTVRPDERELFRQNQIHPFSYNYYYRPETTTRRYYYPIWKLMTTTPEPSTTKSWQTSTEATTTAPTIPKILISGQKIQSWRSPSMSAWKRKQLEKSKNSYVDDYYLQRDRENSQEVQALDSFQEVLKDSADSNGILNSSTKSNSVVIG